MITPEDCQIIVNAVEDTDWVREWRQMAPAVRKLVYSRFHRDEPSGSPDAVAEYPSGEPSGSPEKYDGERQGHGPVSLENVLDKVSEVGSSAASGLSRLSKKRSTAMCSKRSHGSGRQRHRRNKVTDTGHVLVSRETYQRKKARRSDQITREHAAIGIALPAEKADAMADRWMATGLRPETYSKRHAARVKELADENARRKVFVPYKELAAIVDEELRTGVQKYDFGRQQNEVTIPRGTFTNNVGSAGRGTTGAEYLSSNRGTQPAPAAIDVGSTSQRRSYPELEALRARVEELRRSFEARERDAKRDPATTQAEREALIAERKAIEAQVWRLYELGLEHLNATL